MGNEPPEMRCTIFCWTIWFGSTGLQNANVSKFSVLCFMLRRLKLQYRLCNLTFVALQKTKIILPQFSFNPPTNSMLFVFHRNTSCPAKLAEKPACRSKLNGNPKKRTPKTESIYSKWMHFRSRALQEKKLKTSSEKRQLDWYWKKLKRRLLLSNAHRCSFVCETIFICQYFSTSFV